jgi:hypothetical protein
MSFIINPRTMMTKPVMAATRSSSDAVVGMSSRVHPSRTVRREEHATEAMLSLAGIQEDDTSTMSIARPVRHARKRKANKRARVTAPKHHHHRRLLLTQVTTLKASCQSPWQTVMDLIATWPAPTISP